jgi:hypothetical protein
MENEKIFIGSGVEKFDGNLVEATICLTDITKNASEHIYEYEGKKYLSIKVQKKREGADQFGKTHYVEVNTWKPKKKEEAPIQQDLDF